MVTTSQISEIGNNPPLYTNNTNRNFVSESLMAKRGRFATEARMKASAAKNLFKKSPP